MPLLGLPLGKPLPPSVFEIAHQLLFLGVYRNRRLPSFLELLHLRVQEFELGVTVRMLCTLPCLAIGLKAVPVLA